MTNKTDYRKEFLRLNVCVLVPTYNNAGTLQSVLDQILEYTDQVIVVNDGSTDNTHSVLESFRSIQIIGYTKNRGKGFAIKTGFKKAHELGYDYAITMDSDGQHFAHNLPAFLACITETPNDLIIGSRNLVEEENINQGSSFANRISNFWYWVETGYRLTDTQSGYRMYPLHKTSQLQFFTNRYEFEIESIVKAAWNGITVRNIPIDVFYPVKEERVSHFRPVLDFIRISALNTILVLWAFLYVKPIQFFKKLSWKKVRKFIDDNFFKTKEPSWKLASAVGLGVFMGIFPVWGFQLVLSIFIAHLLKLNKLITAVAANISIAPLMPFILYGSYLFGAKLLDKDPSIFFSKQLTVSVVKEDAITYMAGAVGLSVVAGISFGVITYLLLLLFRKTSS